jgi:hypothetical protein
MGEVAVAVAVEGMERLAVGVPVRERELVSERLRLRLVSTRERERELPLLLLLSLPSPSIAPLPALPSSVGTGTDGRLVFGRMRAVRAVRVPSLVLPQAAGMLPREEGEAGRSGSFLRWCFPPTVAVAVAVADAGSGFSLLRWEPIAAVLR